MSGDWTDFDYDLQIEHVTRARDERHAVTGLPVLVADAESDITGSIDFDPMGDEDREAAGLIKTGDAILYTASALEFGDRINVYTDATNFDVWRVKGIDNNYRFIHGGEAKRVGYILERESDG